MYLNIGAEDLVPKLELGQIKKLQNSLILFQIHDKPTRNVFLLLTQEVKRYIYRHMKLSPSAQQVTASQQLAAHLYFTIRRLYSSLQFIGHFNARFVSIHGIYVFLPFHCILTLIPIHRRL
jgi:hypothetical protein